jgi:anti-anti-sigma regulatory factor
MLRITPCVSAHTLILRVEGTLSGLGVEILRSHIESSREPVALDLSGVSFIDSDGTALIDQARAGGITIKAASHFVSLMLEKASPRISDSSAQKEG